MEKIFTVSSMMVNRNGVEDEISIEGNVYYYVDYFYGENADYGLGESHAFIEDVTDVEAWDINGDNVDLTEKEIKEAVSILGIKVLEGTF